MKNPECPVCGATMDSYADYLDGMGPLLESGERCLYGCYFHSYAYGYTEVHVKLGEKTISFGMSYMDEHKDVMDMHNAVTEMTLLARTVLIENLRKLAGVNPGPGFHGDRT